MNPQPGALDDHSGRTVGQYRFLDRIGRGGMGEVYRAHDGRLRRDVAVKVLPARLAADDLARQRFVREARTASRLVHPHVATVFDVVEHERELLLVMELIEGRSLSEALRDAPESLPDRERIAIELAEALSSIHRIGLIHRDVKPANVMITGDGHVKLTDFGVARPYAALRPEGDDSTLTSLTGEGIGPGTFLYMSPEQLRGEALDQRSDLFSFGVVLYEMLTLAHPFRRPTVQETAAAIQHAPPRGGETSTLGRLEPVVRSLLEKEPEHRPASSDVVVQMIREATSRPAPSRLRSPWVLGAIAVLALSLVAGGTWWVGRPLPVPSEPRLRVALVPFADQTNEPDGPVLAGMVADFLSIELGASRLVRPIGLSQTMPLLSGASVSDAQAVARRVARGTAVDYVLTGTLYREEERYVATVNLAAIGPGLSDLPPLRGTGRTIAALAESLGGELRKSMPAVSRLDAWRDDQIDVTSLTSASREANVAYERGLAAMRESKLTEAIEQFERATATDPTFVLAHVQLASALHEAGYGRRAREAATRAEQLVPKGDSPAELRLALVVRATRAAVFDRVKDSLGLWDELVAHFPDEPELLLKSTSAHLKAGDLPRALDRAQRARELDPQSTAVQLQLAEVLMASNTHDEAERAIDEAERLAGLVESKEGMGRAAHVRGQLRLGRGDLTGAESEWKRALEIYRNAGSDVLAARAMEQLSAAAVLQGNTANADALLAAAAEKARGAGDEGLACRIVADRGARHFQSGDFVTAESLLREGADRARQLENDRLLVSPLSNLGSLLSYVGRREEARGVLNAALEIARRIERPNTERQCLRQLADLDYQLGDVRAAISTYERMLKELGSTEDELRAGVRTRLQLAEIYERRGQLEAAERLTTDAIEIAQRLPWNAALGEALTIRSQVLGALGRNEFAQRDLERARRIATTPGAHLDYLEARCRLVGGLISAYRGDWAAAGMAADETKRHRGASAPVMVAAADALACAALLHLNRLEAAAGRCRAAAANEAAPVPERVIARALLAQTLRLWNQPDLARETALTALAEAESMGLLLPAAHAAAVLRRLDGPPGAQDWMERGRRALESYVGSAPETDRQTVLLRQDVRELQADLGIALPARG